MGTTVDNFEGGPPSDPSKLYNCGMKKFQKRVEGQEKLLIVDGHNFLYRGYWGVPISAALSDGTQINAIYGFFALLRNTVQFIDPQKLLVVFDTQSGIQNKLVTNPNYKANRKYEITSIFEQLSLIQKILNSMGIVWIASEDYEADDIIGSCAYQNKNISYIASTDNDFFQLVSSRINVVRSRHGKHTIYRGATIKKLLGIYSQQYTHYQTLKGDPGDNIKGIYGVGPKTACKLINKFGTLENLYNSIELLPPRIQKMLNGKKKSLCTTLDFITINTAIDLKSLLENVELRFSKGGLFGKIREQITREISKKS